MRLRAQVEGAVRAWFRDAGFLEVATTSLVSCPGMEPYLRAYEAADGRYLHTSPELSIKAHLASLGCDVWTSARVYRDEPESPLHAPEFTMLEWYRLGGTLDDIMDDLEAIISRAANACTAQGGTRAPLEPFVRTTVADLFTEHLGFDVFDHNVGEMIAAAGAAGVPVEAHWDWETLFSVLFCEAIEPRLVTPTFVSEYPAEQAALSRIHPEDPRKCLRCELYLPYNLGRQRGVGGMEVANAFDELTDPAAQRARFEGDRAQRAQAGEPVYPVPSAMLDGLAGLPATAGVALGFERLLMWLGARSNGWVTSPSDFMLSIDT